MDAPFDWYPKPFSPGDMEGHGALKLLGKPSLPLIAVLVRETAQNSWDARLPDRSLDFQLHGRHLSSSEVDVLKNTVFCNSGHGTSLSAVLNTDTVCALEVSDRGSSGLGGPIRNDQIYGVGEPTDYVDFVLNIGAKQDKSMGGGTYGYGKTIAYLASEAQTIVIWTKTIVNGQLQSRLIASAFGDQFNHDGRRYTGRQWWGRLNNKVIEPLVSDEADKVGNLLFEKGFENSETGTSILIIQPNLAKNLDELMQSITKSVLWHLWPKLVPSANGELPMKVSIKQNGESIAIPDPARHDFLRGYVRSLETVRIAQSASGVSADLDGYHEVWLGRPKVLLGHIAISKTPCLNPDDSDDQMVPLSGVSSHVALMRHDAELVVTYRKLPTPPYDSVHFCGVFKPSPDVDHCFAQAEPPAHDNWEPAGMADPHEKRHVNVALKQINSIWTTNTRPSPHKESSTENVALGALSSQLSDLVPSLGGTRAGPGQISVSRKKKRKRKRKSNEVEKTDGTNGAASVKRNRIAVKESGLFPIGSSDGAAYVHFDIEGEISGLEVIADIGIGIDGGTDIEAADEYIRSIQFIQGHLAGADLQNRRTSVPNRSSIELFSNKEKHWTLAIVFDDAVALDVAIRCKKAILK